jgi:anaerobic selenocysteine-containing dehydrogenase
VIESGTFCGKPHVIKDLFVACANPLAGAVNCSKMERAWNELDLIVVHSMMFDDTARFADIVLPAVDWWEHADIKTNGCYPVLFFNEQAVEPPFEVRPDSEVVRLLADAMGYNEYFNKSNEEYLTELLQFQAGMQHGITLDALKKNHQMRYADPTEIAFSDYKYNSSTGLAMIYNEEPIPRANVGQTIDLERERIPHFFPPTEAWPDLEIMKKYPLILMSERNRNFCHTQDTGNTWLNEIDPEPSLKINPEDAAPRDIHNGDYVEVYNDRGRAVAKAVLTPAIRPGSLMYPKGWNKHQFKAGRFSELLTDVFDPLAVNMSFFDNVVELRVWDGEV